MRTKAGLALLDYLWFARGWSENDIRERIEAVEAGAATLDPDILTAALERVQRTKWPEHNHKYHCGRECAKDIVIAYIEEALAHRDTLHPSRDP